MENTSGNYMLPKPVPSDTPAQSDDLNVNAEAHAEEQVLPDNGSVSVDAMPSPMESEPTLEPEDMGENLRVVRELLFGKQVKRIEHKQYALERFIRASVSALKEETHLKLDALQKELQKISAQLGEETRDRKMAVSTAHERFANMEQSVDRLGNQIRADQHEIRQRLSQESGKLDQQMQDWRDEILQQLQQTAVELSNNKADRKTVATLLQSMAQELNASDVAQQAHRQSDGE